MTPHVPIPVPETVRGAGTQRPLPPTQALQEWQAGERGSGSVLAVAVVAVISVVTILLLPVLGLLAIGQSVRAAADASALAAADTAAGLVPGVPCELAQRAADLNAARLVTCTVDGLVVTVTVTRNAGGFPVSARARAGPPPAPG